MRMKEQSENIKCCFLVHLYVRAEVKALPEIQMESAEHVIEIKEIIDRKKSPANACKIPRVATPLLVAKPEMLATPLLVAKPEMYIPNFVSLGPYHQLKLEKKIAASSSSSAGDRKPKMSVVEEYKAEFADTFWQNRSKSLGDIVENIKGMREDIADFYDCSLISWDDKYSKDLALMMAIDSSFLLLFLFDESRSSDHGLKCFSRLQASIKCDILKLENQIPPFVLRKVFAMAKEAGNDAGFEDFNKLLQNTYKNLSPFDQFDIAGTEIDDQQHLLGWVHAVVSPFVRTEVIDPDNSQQGNAQVIKRTVFQRMNHSLEVVVEVVVAAIFTIFRVRHPSNNGRRDILKSYNAGELEKGGIKFKSSFEKPHKIRFDKYSGTLYLPQITVSEMQTEVLLRNMLALEFNDADLGDSVTRYVGLMDCLIDTADDVRLLRESQVLLRGSLMLTDESIADMWNGMCHPIFKGHLEPPKHLNQALKEVLIRKYFTSLVKKLIWKYWEFWLDHLSKPGKGVALVVGVLILGMTVIQTYCTWKQWQHEKSHS